MDKLSKPIWWDDSTQSWQYFTSEGERQSLPTLPEQLVRVSPDSANSDPLPNQSQRPGNGEFAATPSDESQTGTGDSFGVPGKDAGDTEAGQGSAENRPRGSSNRIEHDAKTHRIAYHSGGDHSSELSTKIGENNLDPWAERQPLPGQEPLWSPAKEDAQWERCKGCGVQLHDSHQGIGYCYNCVHNLTPERTAAQTRRELNQWAQEHENEYGPDTSKTVHSFDDGWTVRAPQSVADYYREGTLMGNCVNDDIDYQKEPNEQAWANDVYHSLRDPDNIPHVTWRANDGTDALGRHNSTPTKYLKYLNEIGVEPGDRDCIDCGAPAEEGTDWCATCMQHQGQVVINANALASYKASDNADKWQSIPASNLPQVDKNSANEEQGHGWQPQEHDYDPEQDYVLRYDQFDHPLIQQAQQRLNELAARPDTPMNPERPGRVFPADLSKAGPNPASEDGVATYCNGTYNEPCILFDVDAHKGYEDQVGKSVEHEVAHAIQDWNGHDFDEDEAEDWHYGAAQNVMYHVAPMHLDEQIAEEGLVPQPKRRWDEFSTEPHDYEHGIYLWADPQDAQDYAEALPGHHQIYEVDTTGHELIPDMEAEQAPEDWEGERWGSYYTTKPIAPEAVSPYYDEDTPGWMRNAVHQLQLGQNPLASMPDLPHNLPLSPTMPPTPSTLLAPVHTNTMTNTSAVPKWYDTKDTLWPHGCPYCMSHGPQFIDPGSRYTPPHAWCDECGKDWSLEGTAYDRAVGVPAWMNGTQYTSAAPMTNDPKLFNHSCPNCGSTEPYPQNPYGIRVVGDQIHCGQCDHWSPLLWSKRVSKDTAPTGDPKLFHQCPQCHSINTKALSPYGDLTQVTHTQCKDCGMVSKVAKNAEDLLGVTIDIGDRSPTGTIPLPLRGSGYQTTELFSPWTSGSCWEYAAALQEMYPDLRLGAHMANLNLGGTYEPVHVFAHDDTHAYDDYGSHKLPYRRKDTDDHYELTRTDLERYYDFNPKMIEKAKRAIAPPVPLGRRGSHIDGTSSRYHLGVSEDSPYQAVEQAKEHFQGQPYSSDGQVSVGPYTVAHERWGPDCVSSGALSDAGLPEDQHEEFLDNWHNQDPEMREEIYRHELEGRRRYMENQFGPMVHYEWDFGDDSPPAFDSNGWSVHHLGTKEGVTKMAYGTCPKCGKNYWGNKCPHCR